MKKVELLAPAGDLEKLKIAIMYGANAVFCGGMKFSLRAKANNFTLEDLKEAVLFANKYKAKIHVTVNIVPEDFDMKELDDYLLSLDKIHVHAIIVSSIYIMIRARQLKCKFEVHVSTQQSTSNYKAIEFFDKVVCVDRVVLGRELNIDQIKEIKEKSKVEIESFIHGGMCSSFSGRCTLSNSMADRDANKGGCAHSCRWIYHLYDNQNQIGHTNFIMASTDLMSIQYIPKLLSYQIDSFKIEGRMKSIHYIATVVSAYRRMIDEYYNNTLTNSKIHYYEKEILKAENRITYTGFLDKKMKNQALLLNTGVENPTQTFIGLVVKSNDENNNVLIEVRNNFKEKINAECFLPNGQTFNIKINCIYDTDGNKLDVARHPKQIIKTKIKYYLPVNTLIRKR